MKLHPIAAALLLLAYIWALAWLNNLTPDRWYNYWWGLPLILTEVFCTLGYVTVVIWLALPPDIRKP